MRVRGCGVCVENEVSLWPEKLWAGRLCARELDNPMLLISRDGTRGMAKPHDGETETRPSALGMFLEEHTHCRGNSFALPPFGAPQNYCPCRFHNSSAIQPIRIEISMQCKAVTPLRRGGLHISFTKRHLLTFKPPGSSRMTRTGGSWLLQRLGSRQRPWLLRCTSACHSRQKRHSRPVRR